MKCFLLFCGLLMSAYGAGPIAEVVLVRGKATMLRPGAWIAYEIKTGDKILEDSSIVTHDKSLVKLKFIDETTVNLGPNSKMVVAEFSNGNPGVVDLLRGRIRTSVQKTEGSAKNKFYIKTRTAAMAVRGTEFQTIYNPDNQNTSLLTYKGEVAMVKLTENELSSKETVIKEARGTSPSEVNVQENPHVLDTAEGLQKTMDAKKGALIVAKAGQYSGSLPGLSSPTIPVKISPEQLNTLYQNESLEEKAAGEKVNITPSTKPTLEQAAQAAPPEGFYNRETSEYAPKAGGYIDTKSGIYIPPTSNSSYDDKLGVYNSKELGFIDSDSGQYIPPQGIRLDSQKGFVVYSDTTSEALLAQAESLNANLKSDLVFVAPIVPYNNHERSEVFKDQEIIFSYKIYSEKLDYTSDSVRGARSFSAASGDEAKLDWEQSTSKKWKTHGFVAYKDIKFNSIGDESGIQGSTSLLTMGVGTKYFISNSWQWKFDLSIDQNFFLNYESGATNLVKVAMTKLSTGFDWNFFNHKRWSADLDFGIILSPAKETGALTVESGMGTDLGLRVNYWWGKNIRSVLGAWTQNQSSTSSDTTGFSAESSRSQNGLNLGLQYHF
jgi:hypothetical protein